jgi:hypothetical protein
MPSVIGAARECPLKCDAFVYSRDQDLIFSCFVSTLFGLSSIVSTTTLLRLAGLVAMATGFSAAALDGRDRTTAEVAQLQNPHQNLGALLFQRAENVGQCAPPS